MSDQERAAAQKLAQELLTVPEVKSHDSQFSGEVAFVAPRSAAAAVSAVVEKELGPATKPGGVSVPDDVRQHPLVRAIGGIRGDQTLYMKELVAGVLYVAYWPWGGGDRFTIKVGVYPSSDEG